MTKIIKVFPPHGWIDLESYSGTDLDVVNAAKVSFAKQSDSFEDAEERILNFLMREKHGSPFEHNYFKFHVRAPIFVVREWQRHRIGVSYNEESGRYTELRPDFYVPETARIQEGRPGAYRFEDGDESQTDQIRTAVMMHCKNSFRYYEHLLSSGIAKEQARILLPLNTYTEFYFTCNARSLMNFLELRMSSHAMYEIRKYAEAMYKLWAEVMPQTAIAFEDHGFVAP